MMQVNLPENGLPGPTPFLESCCGRLTKTGRIYYYNVPSHAAMISINYQLRFLWKVSIRKEEFQRLMD
jgi:hypothetical protein